MDIIVTPNQQFRVVGEQSSVAPLASAFRRSAFEGLLTLVQQPATRSSSASTLFWHDFAATFMKTFCAFSELDPLQIPIDESALSQHVRSLPLMPGAENISKDFLHEVWQGLEHTVIKAVAQTNGHPRQYIAREFPSWSEVGKVHFHLAENRVGDGKPFAFLATYSVRVPGKARVQHRPLGAALKESLRIRNQHQLEQLLAPIYRASKESAFVERLVDTQSIYRPVFLDPSEAYTFIKDIPVCEQAGIICKVPRWWQKGQPAKVKVSVKIDAQERRNKVGVSELLAFDVGVAVGGEPLTAEQLEQLMASEGPLVDLGGKWVEVDRERIKQMLAVWNKAVASAYAGGISFAQAMRLFAGFGLTNDEGHQTGESNAARDWVDVVAGDQFRRLLETIRDPAARPTRELDEVLEQHLKGVLRPYQYVGLNWLQTITGLQLGGCLADDMGLGKTIQILAMLIAHKYLVKPAHPSLLVVPASLLGNWQNEIAKFAPSLNYIIIHGSSDDLDYRKHKPKTLSDVDVAMTTYGMVVRSHWIKETLWHTVIADEAQAIKNAKTKQSSAMRHLKASAKVAMTGTPVENSLADLWSIFDFCCPGLLGTESQFKRGIKRLREQSASSGPPLDYEPLRQLIAPYILRRKKTDKQVISDLPDKIEMDATCYLMKRQAVLYEKEVEALAIALHEAEGIARKGLILSSLMKFKQICNHPSQYLSNNSYAPSQSGKFAKLKDIAETIAASGEKVLVFTQFRELTDVIAHFLGQCFGREGLILHGGTPVKQRQKLVDRFQDPSGPAFFVLSLKAGGTGLNLTQASHVIHFDRWWNPAVENQATDRAFRIGQKRNVVVHKLVCKGTVEEKIAAMIAEKQQLADSLIEGKSEINVTELSNEELLDLVRLDIQSIARE